MSTAIILIVAFVSAVAITFIVLCVYIKLLSYVAGKLRQVFYNVSETRSNTRKESSIEICCIQCFDKAYYGLHSSVGFIRGVIKNL